MLIDVRLPNFGRHSADTFQVLTFTKSKLIDRSKSITYHSICSGAKLLYLLQIEAISCAKDCTLERMLYEEIGSGLDGHYRTSIALKVP